jgi:hypothetical protein
MWPLTGHVNNGFSTLRVTMNKTAWSEIKHKRTVAVGKHNKHKMFEAVVYSILHTV